MEKTSEQREVKQLGIELLLWLTANSPGHHVTKMALRQLGYVSKEDVNEYRDREGSSMDDRKNQEGK